MSLRRLHHEQPASFAFTAANAKWAQLQIGKYPEGRQASAVIPLLWRAQEQEGWISKPAIEHIAEMLDLAYIRVLEVATFYFMFQLQPVGSVAHVQVCGTTSCMICGAEDLISVCREMIASNPHDLSDDGRFSWEEVECLGACANAPMVQIGKDFYEDLTVESFTNILNAFADGKVPTPGSQTGRFAAEPASGLTSLKDFVMPAVGANASVARAQALGDTVARIDGTEDEYANPTLGNTTTKSKAVSKKTTVTSRKKSADGETTAKQKAGTTKPTKIAPNTETTPGTKPAGLKTPKNGVADDLKRIKGIGPKLEKLCNSLGFFHFEQIEAWSDAEVAWVDTNLEGFKGRVTRDSWVSQAKVLAAGGDTAFSKKQGK